MSTGPQVNRSLLVAITLLVVLTLSVTRFDTFFRQVQYEDGDAAVNSLQIEKAKHLREIYGNYSRFEFNHPGPAFWYTYAASEWLLHDTLHVAPSPASAHLFACVALQGLFFALALVVCRTHVPHRAFLPLALVAAGLHYGYLGDAFVSTWPPNVLLMPFLCFLAAVVSVATGRISHLPIAVLAGGFLFHGHVAQPMFVGGLGLLMLAGAARELRRDPAVSWPIVARQHRATLWLSGGLAGLFLLPVLIDVVTLGRESNVATILGRFQENSEQGHSAFTSLLYFITFATDSREQETLFGQSGHEVWRFIREHGLRILVWAAVFTLPPIVAWVRRRRMTPELARFLTTGGAVLAATIVLCVLWGKAQAGAMYNYNSYFYYSIYFFALLLALALVAPWFDRVMPRPIAIVLGVAAIAFLGWKEKQSGTEPYGTEVPAGIDAVLAKDGAQRPKLLVFEHSNWPHVAAAALQLQRRHVDFFMAPWWAFMFGRGHELTRLGEHPEQRASIWWITHPGPGGIPLTPELSVFTTPAPIQPTGDTISLAGGANGFRYVVEGLSAGNLDCATTELPRVLFRFATPRTDRDVRITFDAQALDLAPKEVHGEVSFNGTRLGNLTFVGRSGLAVTVPAALWNAQPTGDLELRLTNALPKRQARRPAYVWWAGLQLYRVTFAPVP